MPGPYPWYLNPTCLTIWCSPRGTTVGPQTQLPLFDLNLNGIMSSSQSISSFSQFWNLFSKIFCQEWSLHSQKDKCSRKRISHSFHNFNVSTNVSNAMFISQVFYFIPSLHRTLIDENHSFILWQIYIKYLRLSFINSKIYFFHILSSLELKYSWKLRYWFSSFST